MDGEFTPIAWYGGRARISAPFEPSWDEDEATDAQGRWEAALPHFYGRMADEGPFHRWLARNSLEHLHYLFAIRGDSKALLRAIRDCSDHGLDVPYWAATAFAAGVHAVQFASAMTWDRAFGRPYPKGAHKTKERARWWQTGLVLAAVIQARLKGSAISQSVFDEVGEAIGLSGATVSRLWYRALPDNKGLAQAMRDAPSVLRSADALIERFQHLKNSCELPPKSSQVQSEHPYTLEGARWKPQANRKPASRARSVSSATSKSKKLRRSPARSHGRSRTGGRKK